ncbi:MAG: RHS repeat-associated core domain-containing protein [bacterium]|nr:RHS repeat-associated core domain-containing protein [bacterium]
MATYDAANRLSQMTRGALSWTFAYDNAGNRTRLTHPNSTSTDYAYLNNHWLLSITDKAPGGATFQSTGYTHDPNGNRLTQADSSGTTTFAYDALNRLIQAAHPGGYGTFTWTYDAVGNRTQQTAPGGTTNYAYDHNSRLLTAGSTTYAYDANGNLLSISTGQTFAWDVFNRMTQATGSGGTVTHTYNGDGLKTRRVGPDGTRNYYYDGIKPIWETDGAGVMTAQLDRDIFGNLLSRREASGARRYYHFDGLGSTTALTNESGAATSTLLYDAWGNQRAATGSDQGRYRFTGAELDQATGFYHMGARFYDPTIGRWLSEDPVQDKHFEPATLNFYAYAFNNPVNLTDATGLSPIGDLVAGWIAAGEDAAKNLKEHWDKINAIIDAMSAAGLQINLGLAVFLAGTISATPGAASGGTHRHHNWPMYLGGAAVGIKTAMDATIHLAYHGFLDRSGLARRNAAEFTKMIEQGRLQEILSKLADATRRFDKEFGTQLLRPFLEELRRHGYRF